MKINKVKGLTAACLSAAMLATLVVLVLPAAAGACGYSKWYLPEGYRGQLRHVHPHPEPQ